MKLGKLTPQGAVEYDGWEKIYEHEISASDTEAQLLATFQGADGATSGNADTGQAITFAGTAKIENTQSKIGATSLFLDGNSDYVTVPDSADWAFGTGDFTIDCWARFSDLTNKQVIVGQYVDSNNYWNIYKHSAPNANQIYFVFVSGGVEKGYYFNTSGGSITVDTWHHIACVRNGTGAYIFIDGVSQTLTEQTAFSTNDVGNIADVLDIGYRNSTNYVDGYIDGLRITKGEALWTSNFTPPTTIDDYVGTSAITIFGLEGDTDEQYMLDLKCISALNAVETQVRFNGDAGNNYGYQHVTGTDSVISAFRGATSYIDGGYIASTDKLSNSNMLIHAKSGFVRTALVGQRNNITGTTIDYCRAAGGSWNNTVDEITSMSIIASANTFKIGTSISLYRRITS